MHQPEANCKELVECTANALKSDEILQRNFVRMQRNSLQVMMKCALDWALIKSNDILKESSTWSESNVSSIAKGILHWFPHIEWFDYHDYLVETLYTYPRINVCVPCFSLFFSFIHYFFVILS